MAAKKIYGRDAASGSVLCVELERGVIVAISRCKDGHVHEGRWIAPGLVDLQVNGYKGIDFNNPSLTIEQVEYACDALRKTGVTMFVPTVITGPFDRVRQCLAVVMNARSRIPSVEQAIPFVHLEGPWISPKDGPRGCHDVQYVRKPDEREFDEWQRAAGGLIGMVTLSPHWDGIAGFIGALRAKGVRVSIGHTHASSEQILSAVDAGARYSTHLGNGADRLLPRHPNYLWAQLAERRLNAGFIADGHHLDRLTLAAMVRAKGISRSYLVSDIAAVGGVQPGRYATNVGGTVIVTDDGRLLADDTGYLAGAVSDLSVGVANAAGSIDITLAQSLVMATVNPGRIVSPAGMVGDLVVGCRSGVITFGWGMGSKGLDDISVF